MAGWVGIDDLPTLVGKAAVHRNAVFDVVIFPFPLKTSDFNGEFSFAGVFHRDQGFRSGNRHDNQNDAWNDRPDNFSKGAVMERGWFVADRLTMHDHRVEHRSENDDADDDADP